MVTGILINVQRVIAPVSVDRLVFIWSAASTASILFFNILEKARSKTHVENHVVPSQLGLSSADSKLWYFASVGHQSVIGVAAK